MSTTQATQAPPPASGPATPALPVKDLEGRVAVVTGAGRGIGQSIALALANGGAQVVLISRSAEQLDETAAMIGEHALTQVADLARLDQVESLATDLWAAAGGIDIVVHAAGQQLRKPAIEVTAAELEQIVAVNLSAPFLLSAALGRRALAEARPGRHLFIGSLTSHIGIDSIVPYGITKSGLLGAVRGLAREWAHAGITVNAVLPGYVRTNLTEPLLEDAAKLAWVESRIPQGRLGAPEDVAAACRFLCSDAAGYITGQALAVDGGWLAS